MQCDFNVPFVWVSTVANRSLILKSDVPFRVCAQPMKENHKLQPITNYWLKCQASVK
jgi:hypothetical protein